MVRIQGIVFQKDLSVFGKCIDQGFAGLLQPLLRAFNTDALTTDTRAFDEEYERLSELFVLLNARPAAKLDQMLHMRFFSVHDDFLGRVTGFF